MQPTTITIQADSESLALAKAAKEFKTAPDNVRVQSKGSGSFEASMTNVDADLDVEVSEDLLTATVVNSRQPKGLGRPLSMNRLESILADKGVRIAPILEAAESLIRKLSKGETVTDLVIARGRKPTPASHAKLEPLGDWKYPVLPGDAVGKLIPAVQSQPGILVTGKKLGVEGDRKGKSLNFPEDSNCYFDKTSLLVRSEVYGLVEINKQDVSIVPLMEISADSMEVRADIYAKDFQDKPLSRDRMQTALNFLDIKEPVDASALSQAVDKAEQEKKPVPGVVVCMGMQPRHGRDGYFEMLYKDDRPTIGVETEDGKFDYRARGVIRSVQKGELLGRIMPPESGMPGRDIYGRIIPAKEGVAFNLVVGQNVEANATKTEYRSTDVGMVHFLGNKLEVTDVFQTKGDVNLTYGNIVVEKGSVHIRGAVLSGFSVTSPRNILVNDAIESATVHAEGDIEVRGGIVMEREGLVSAKGGISAMYAKNATISAEGDVNIAHEIANCTVRAGRWILAKRGRGKIIGGVLRCGSGIEANEIGSELGVETAIFLGDERSISKTDVARRKRLQNALQKIYGIIGTGDPKAILAGTRDEKKEMVTRLLKTRVQAEKEIKYLEDKMEREREHLRRTINARVRVYKTLYPGVVINCLGSVYTPKAPVTYSQIYYDPREERFVVGSL